MKNVLILALEDSLINSIDSVLQIFSRANDFLKYGGKEEFYNIKIVSGNGTVILNNGTYQIKTALIDSEEKADLIIIPIICGNFNTIIEKNTKYQKWICAQYDLGAEIASLCVGTFFLASTGLLDGRNCATHWAVIDEFRRNFPKVNILDEKIITDENGLYTSGGNFSYLNLLLYIIEKDLGHEIAVITAKMFEIDINRNSQLEYYIFQGQKNHNNQVIKEIQIFIELHYEKDITVNSICKKFSVTRRTLERNFKKFTGNTIFEYIQRVRVENAKRLLENTEMTVNEIVYNVGYNDINAFRNLFKRVVNMSPSEYSRKYRKQLVS